MNKPILTDIPQHLLVNCIQKMEPRAFARAYRSCSAMKYNIDSNERRISISLPHQLSIEAISEGKEILTVKVVKGRGLVFWSETFSPEEIVEMGIPSLACFNFASVSIKWGSLSPVEINQLLTVVQKYRVTARRGLIFHSNPFIHEIVRVFRLKEVDVQGPIYHPSAESWLFSEEVTSMKKLIVDRTQGSLAVHLLRHVASRCPSVHLKVMGRVKLFLELIASCLKDIQRQGEMRNGTVGIAEYGDDIPTAAVLEKFANSQYEMVEELSQPCLVLPFQESGRLLLSWKKYYTPLKKLRGINFAYGSVTCEEDLRDFFKTAYPQESKESTERLVQQFLNRYL